MNSNNSSEKKFKLTKAKSDKEIKQRYIPKKTMYKYLILIILVNTIISFGIGYLVAKNNITFSNIFESDQSFIDFNLSVEPLNEHYLQLGITNITSNFNIEYSGYNINDIEFWHDFQLSQSRVYISIPLESFVLGNNTISVKMIDSYNITIVKSIKFVINIS
jgi:hypothetical protein